MTAASEITITYDDQDITRHVLFSDCSFESAIQATPGAFNVTLKDPDRTLGPFTTGKELKVSLDGIRFYGGYVLQAYRRNFFPAVDTHDLSRVHTRQWILKGMDYNYKFDKLVLYNHGTPTKQVDNVAHTTYDGAIIRSFFPSVFDFESGWDLTTYVQDIHQFPDAYIWQTPGSTARDQLSDLAQYGAFFYADALKRLHYEPVQALVPSWGFSDTPAASRALGGTWIGYREGQSIIDATAQTDDAFVWGGTQFSNNGKGTVIFARKKDAPTIAAHGLWQYPEIHVGDTGFASQAQVTARANAIITGASDGTVIGNGVGMLLPEDQYQATWFGHDVPRVLGVPQHLVPGAVTPLHVWTFSEDGGLTPYILNLPLKQLKISFPTLEDGTGKPYVRFDGFFGIQQSDPNWLWNYLLKQSRGSIPGTATKQISIATGPLPVSQPPGTFYSGPPTEPLDGTTTVFHLPFPYISGSVSVYLNGLLQRPGNDFSETDPSTGSITFSSAPPATDTVIIDARTAGGTLSGGGGGGGSLLYGMGIGADGLANTVCGHDSESGTHRQFMRFRAIASSPITTFRFYYLGDDPPGYSGGTGGHFTLEIYADDGSSSHYPTGSALAVASASPGVSNDAGLLITFGSPFTPTAGNIYHFVFTNTDGDTEHNYFSPDYWYVAQTPTGTDDGRVTPAYPDSDFAHGYYDGSGWVTRIGYIPVCDIGYASGAHQGSAYGEASYGPGEVGLISGANNKVRESIVVSGSSRVVNGAGVRLLRRSGSDPLTVSLFDSGHSLVGSFTIPAAIIALGLPPDGTSSDNGLGLNAKWVGGSFSGPITLTLGAQYFLEFSTASGSIYYAWSSRRLSDYGYTSATYFSDGVAEKTTDGSSWSSLGRSDNENDLQFFFS